MPAVITTPSGRRGSRNTRGPDHDLGVNQTMKQLQSDPLPNTSQRKRRKLAPNLAHGLLATYQTQITRIVSERRKSAAIQSQTRRRERRRNTKRNPRKRSTFLIAHLVPVKMMRSRKVPAKVNLKNARKTRVEITAPQTVISVRES